MRRFAVVLCQDAPSLHALETVLDQLAIEPVLCASPQQAMEAMLDKHCAALLVDLDLPGAEEVARVAALLAPPHKPLLMAMTGAWRGTGLAAQSGINRVLYKPLDIEQMRDAFSPSREVKKKAGRKAPRYEVKTVVYLEFDTGSLPAIGVNISEHGFAVRATEPILQRADLPFRCALPGSTDVLEGRVDVIWADKDGRAGMFFSRLAPSARRRLRHWLHKHAQEKGTVRALLPPVGASAYALVSK
jgi:hypothetical protein